MTEFELSFKKKGKQVEVIEIKKNSVQTDYSSCVPDHVIQCWHIPFYNSSRWNRFHATDPYNFDLSSFCQGTDCNKFDMKTKKKE